MSHRKRFSLHTEKTYQMEPEKTGHFYYPAGSLSSNRHSMPDTEEQESEHEDLEEFVTKPTLIFYESHSPSSEEELPISLAKDQSTMTESSLYQIQRDCEGYISQNKQLREEVKRATTEFLNIQNMYKQAVEELEAKRKTDFNLESLAQMVGEIIAEDDQSWKGSSSSHLYNYLGSKLEILKSRMSRLSSKNEQLTAENERLKSTHKEIPRKKEDEEKTSTPSIEELEIIHAEPVNYGEVMNDLKEITSRASRALEVTAKRKTLSFNLSRPMRTSVSKRKYEYEALRRKYGVFK